MKSLIQLILTSCVGFALGCALMYREQPLMITAGVLCALAFFAAYLIVFIAHAIYKSMHRNVRHEDYEPESMLGFDSHGKLKIESDYFQR